MRRTITSLFVTLASLGFLASGAQHVAYSEAVQANMITADDAAISQVAAKTVAPTPTPQAVVASAAVRPATPAVKGNTLSIAAIGFAAPVVNVGVTETNNIDVPAGAQVGRWTGGALPGERGAVFLDGHVDGVFANLRSVGVGHVVTMTYGGQLFSYKVVHTETVPLDGIDMRRALSVYGGAPEGLNMMTCAGTFVRSMGTYDQRLIVYAVRV